MNILDCVLAFLIYTGTKKDIFILYKDRELVNKCLDTVGIENIDCRSAVAYFVLKGCVGDKLSTSDLKKLITAFIIWR